jgi:hypothetical protein
LQQRVSELEAKAKASDGATETLRAELEAKAKASEEAAEALRAELEMVKGQKGSLEEEKKQAKMLGGLGNYLGKALVQNALDSGENSKQFLNLFQARMINSDI